MSIKVGEPVMRLPRWCQEGAFPTILRNDRKATIVYVHYAHRWYMVQYEKTGLRECFPMRNRLLDPKGGLNDSNTPRVCGSDPQGKAAKASGGISETPPGADSSGAAKGLHEKS